MSVKSTGAMATSAFVPHLSKDKLYIISLVTAMTGGLWLSLQSAGFLLAFNVNTLMIMAVVFAITSANFVMAAKPLDVQIRYSALAVVPIVLRFAFNLPLFSSYANVTVDIVGQVMFALQVCVLWILVAVAEESFRATMMNVYEAIFARKNRSPNMNAVLKVVFSVGLWILFHFIQRPFDPFLYRYYILWLFISGVVMSYAMLKGGLGSATMIHFIVNLTA